MGAMVALRMALLEPARVSGLVLLGASETLPSEASKKAFGQVRDIWVATPTPSEEIMNISIVAWGGAPDVNGDRATRVKDYWVKRHSGPEHVDEILFSVLHRSDITDRLGEIQAPVLLIHGEKDETYPLADAELIRDKLTGSADVQLKVIDGSGHLVIHMRDPHDIAQLINNFAAKTFAI
jgi:pimeloyl-ACP methyl ester carboxylesterase